VCLNALRQSCPLASPPCILVHSAVTMQIAKNLGQTLRAFQPTIRELQQVSQDFKSALDQEVRCVPRSRIEVT
jgi:hypothetical protein